MAELARWVGRGMDARNHHEFLRDVVANHVALALAQAEEVSLIFKDFSDLLVHFNILICKRHVDSLRQKLDVPDQSLTLASDLFVDHGSLFIREPDAHKSQSYNLWYKGLDIGVAETALHVESDIFIVLVQDCAWKSRVSSVKCESLELARI